MKLKIRQETIVDESDWSEFVSQVYKRPYRFQQQDDCRSRGVFRFEVPSEADDYENDSVNGDEMGVSFSAWLKRKPNKPLPVQSFRNSSLMLWWERNFYPDIQMVANDLHEKGLLEAGRYTLDIDW